MSMDFSVKPVPPPAAPVASTVSAPVNDAVRTQLPVALTVNATSASGFARNDSQPSPDSFSRQIVIDRDAAAYVYQVIDERTDEVVRQFPENAELRRRAYFRALDLLKDQQSAIPTDRTA